MVLFEQQKSGLQESTLDFPQTLSGDLVENACVRKSYSGMKRQIIKYY